MGLTAEDSDYVPTEAFYRSGGVGNNSVGNRGSSGSRGASRRKILSHDSTVVVGSFNDSRSLASSLSFSESVTDEDSKRQSFGAGGEKGMLMNYGPPVDTAVDAAADPTFSCVSTSEMEGGASEDGGGGGEGVARGELNATMSDVTPERPPRKPRAASGAGTRSNSDTDGGKRDTIKARNLSPRAGGLAGVKSEGVAVSEPEARRKEHHHPESAGVKSSSGLRHRRPSGATSGSPKKKSNPVANGASTGGGEKISPMESNVGSMYVNVNSGSLTLNERTSE